VRADRPILAELERDFAPGFRIVALNATVRSSCLHRQDRAAYAKQHGWRFILPT